MLSSTQWRRRLPCAARRSGRMRAAAVVALVVAAVGARASETELTLVANITTALDTNGGRFGFEIAAAADDSSYVLIGSRNSNRNSANQGSVYGVDFSPPTSFADPYAILPFSGGGDDQIGAAIARNGDWAVFGAPSEDRGGSGGANIGKVYLYHFNEGTWEEEMLFSASDNGNSDLFGRCLSWDNTTVIVSAPGWDSESANVGAIYVFAFNATAPSGSQLTETAILTASDAGLNEQMGLHNDMCQIRDGWIVAGARLATINGQSEAGIVRIWRQAETGEFVEHSTVNSTVPQDTGQFGTAVALNSGFLFVGADLYDVDGVADAGMVSVFQHKAASDSWVHFQDITRDWPEPDDQFGTSVSAYGGRLAVGAYGTDNGYSPFNAEIEYGGYTYYISVEPDNVGSAFLYDLVGGQWTLTANVTNPPIDTSTADGVRDADARFGEKVELTSSFLFVGAPNVDNAATIGTVYVYSLPATPGVFGDPWIVDLEGHRFPAGGRPYATYLLFRGPRNAVTFTTGNAKGKEDGYFIQSLTIVQGECGSVTVGVIAGTRDLDIDASSDCARTLVAHGDNGLAALSIEGGLAHLVTRPHLSDGFSFLNIRFVEAAPGAICKGDATGMMCESGGHKDLLLEWR